MLVFCASDFLPSDPSDYLTFWKGPEGGIRLDFPFCNMAGDTGTPFLGSIWMKHDKYFIMRNHSQ